MTQKMERSEDKTTVGCVLSQLQSFVLCISQNTEAKELERVNTLKNALQEFTV